MKSKTLSLIIIALLSTTALISSAQSWSLSGNSGTNTTNFLGTKDPKPLVFKTNKIERIRIAKTGEIYIGTASLTNPFNVENSNVEIEINVPENVRNVFIKFTDTIGRIKKTSVTRSRSKRKINAQKVQLTEMTYRYFLHGWEIN
jgi:hypothetical protein